MAATGGTGHDGRVGRDGSTGSLLDRHYFLIRRLHSLTGVAPIGLFLLPHLTTNSSIVWGRFLAPASFGPEGAPTDLGVATFQHEVNFIHSLPALALIEWGVLFLPILFHAIVGVWFATSGSVNLQRYAYQDNWRYTLQRLTGYIGIVYIFLHITSLRYGWTYGGLLPAFDAHHAASTTAGHFQDGIAGLLVAVFYAVGVLSLVFHFANGLWTAAITWGLTVSVQAQQRWGWVCAAVGFLLAGAGIAAIAGFVTLDIETAREIENAMH